MSRGEDLAAAAAGFVGVPFRLHGHDPRTGLDCVGLVTASLEAIGHAADPPRGYGLRNSSITNWLDHAQLSGLVVAKGSITPGDVLLVRSGPGQHHLMIAQSAASVIHAHAGLRRVVRQPLAPDQNLAAQWRLTV